MHIRRGCNQRVTSRWNRPFGIDKSGWLAMNNLMDWVSCYYLWIVKERTASPPDTLDHLNDIVNLKFRGSIDSRHCPTGVQYLKTSRWSSLLRNCRIQCLISWFLPHWYFIRNYHSCKTNFSPAIRHVFEYNFHKCPCQKKSCVNTEQGKHKRNHDLRSSVWSSQGVVPRNSLDGMYNISH